MVGPAGAMEVHPQDPAQPLGAYALLEPRCSSMKSRLKRGIDATPPTRFSVASVPRLGTSSPFNDRLLRWAFEKDSVRVAALFIQLAKGSIKKPTRNGEIPAPGGGAELRSTVRAHSARGQVLQLGLSCFSELAVHQCVPKNLVGACYLRHAGVRKAPN